MVLAAGGVVDIADLHSLGIKAVQGGTYSATITASNFNITTVTFPVPFGSLPKVYPIVRTGSGAAIGSFFQITALSNTSVNIRWGTPATVTLTTNIDWVAVETL